MSIFTKSKDFKEEYCASIVRIGEIKPIEKSKFLATTIVNGVQIVIRKDQVKEGEIMFYAQNETAFQDESFLSCNNLYEISERVRNSNYNEVESLLEMGSDLKQSALKIEDENERVEMTTKGDKLIEEANRKCGYFNKYARVRMIKLQGEYSKGYLFTKEEMSKYNSKISKIDLESLVGTDFDTVDGVLFIKAYVPFVNNNNGRSSSNGNKRDKKLKRFDRMIDGEFKFHYDTSMLGKNMHIFSPDTKVAISVKEHGTSFICGNIKVKKPFRLMPHKWIWNKICDLFKCPDKKFINYNVDYDIVYSSRSIIKNQFINEKAGQGFYKVDVWTEYGNLLKPYLTKDLTVYGEICGYLTNSQSMIQKQYDYGCKPGENYLMIYRIVTDIDGNKYEWDVQDVQEWTVNLVNKNPELKGKIKPINVLYHGTLGDLYPDINKSLHWNENVLERLKNDKERFGMECNEPLCKNKVPREGIVIRIDGDEKPEAFKLKTDAFYSKESKLIDSGEVDIEMADNFN